MEKLPIGCQNVREDIQQYCPICGQPGLSMILHQRVILILCQLVYWREFRGWKKNERGILWLMCEVFLRNSVVLVNVWSDSCTYYVSCAIYYYLLLVQFIKVSLGRSKCISKNLCIIFSSIDQCVVGPAHLLYY